MNVYGGSDYWNPSMRTHVIAHKAKIIYEFDAADIPGSYMYPAMARSFRAAGPRSPRSSSTIRCRWPASTRAGKPTSSISCALRRKPSAS